MLSENTMHKTIKTNVYSLEINNSIAIATKYAVVL